MGIEKCSKCGELEAVYRNAGNRHVCKGTVMETKHYALVASFDEYTGNFAREMTAWVFGLLDENGRDAEVERPHAEKMKWAWDADKEDGILGMFAHDEYGMVWQDVNVYDHANGVGTINWQLTEAPTKDQMDILREIMNALPEQRWTKHPTLLDLKLYEVVTTTTDVTP